MELRERSEQLDWAAVEESLWQSGYARLGKLLDPAECAELIGLYNRDELFRSRIEMARYRFGEGDYKYFAYPLPPAVDTLRAGTYPQLVGTANRWMEALGLPDRFPGELRALLGKCHSLGQSKPTPLLLHYEAADTTACIRIFMVNLPSRSRSFAS